MEGWIIYRKSHKELSLDDYEVNALLAAAQERNIEIKVYKPEQFDLVVCAHNRATIIVDGIEQKVPNFIIPRQGAKTTHFTLAVIRHLENAGVYSINSSAAIEKARDKLHIHQILANSGMPTPKTMIVRFPVNLDIVRREIGFPVVVKNISGMKGAGVYLSESEDKLADLMDLIYENNNKANIILQEYVKSSIGKDLRVIVLGGKAIGCMQRTAAIGFKANISRGGTAASFQLSDEIERLSIETARLVGLDLAGIDLLFDETGFKICEANSSPGFRGIDPVISQTIAPQLLDYIMTRIQR